MLGAAGPVLRGTVTIRAALDVVVSVEVSEHAGRALAAAMFGADPDDLVYLGSQPWPFPHSLMVGFRAEWTSGHIEIDPSEIVDAQWYTRDSLPPIPPGISIARKLIDAWLAEG